MAAGLGDEIAEYIAANIGSLVVGTNLFVGRLSDQPDAAVAIHEHGGAQPLMSIGTPGTPDTMAIDQPTFQVLVRDLQYAPAQDRIQAIYGLLEGTCEKQLNPPSGAHFHLIYALQSPVHLGRDEKQRHEMSLNMRCYWRNLARP